MHDDVERNKQLKHSKELLEKYGKRISWRVCMHACVWLAHACSRPAKMEPPPQLRLVQPVPRYKETLITLF